MEMIDVLKKLEEIAKTKPELVADAVDNVSRTNPAEVENNAVQTERVGGMSDIHIGAEEVVGEYTDADGNLERPKQDVLRAMAADKAKASFPRSYEIEVAMDMVNDKFDDSGESKPDMDMSSEQPSEEPEAKEGNAFADAVQKATGEHPNLPHHLEDLWDRKERLTVLPNKFEEVSNYIADNSRVELK